MTRAFAALEETLRRYDVEALAWAASCVRYEDRGYPVPASECERHSDVLEGLAEEFAVDARAVLAAVRL